MHVELIENKSNILAKLPILQLGDGDEEKISSLTQFVHIINRLAQEAGIDLHTDGGRLFFRGQASSSWGVEPSIFRNGQLSLEHKYLRTSITRLPQEFSNISAFDRLTKLQHYGLPTRLLDVTHNPLVALYFACEEAYEKNEEGGVLPSDGAVYIAYSNAELPESLNTQVLSNISAMDLSKMELGELWSKLVDLNFGLNQSSPENIVKLLQKYTANHFVLSDLSNERIIRQCGAFLVCGCINIRIGKKNSEYSSSVVTKAKDNMKSEFFCRVIIDVDEKSSLLDELDFYNINEGTLFPELEHQLKYITTSNKRFVIGSDDYKGIIQSEVLPSEQSLLQKDSQAFLTSNAAIIVQTIIPQKEKAEAITQIIMQNTPTDWFKRENIQAKQVAEIKRYLLQNGDDSDYAKKTSRMIVDSLLRKYYTES